MALVAQNALEQLTEIELGAVAGLIGFNAPSAGFRNYLREMPPLTLSALTIGDFARAYLEFVRGRLAK